MKPVPQSSHLACQQGNNLFILCNYASDSVLSDLYVMNCSRESVSWSMVSMNERPLQVLYGGAMMIINSLIVVYGGYLKGVALNGLYVYDHKLKRWKTAVSDEAACEDDGYFGIEGLAPPRTWRSVE